MPSYTLNNWDGRLSNSHEHTSSQMQEKHRSPSNTIYSRSTPIPAQTKKKLSITGPVNLNKRGDDVRGEGSSELVEDSPNGIPIFQGPWDVNFLSTQQNGSHGLIIQTTLPLNDAPELLKPARLTFTPILESPLHANKTFTRRDASQTDAFQLFRPPTTDSTPRNNEDSLDGIETISMHTMDAEGEVEDEEFMIVENILTSYSPTKPHSPNSFDMRPNRNSSPPDDTLNSPLFTPLPSEASIPADRLFTPDPEVQRKNLPLVMSHVEVPPLRRPKSDYRSYEKTAQVSDYRPHEKKKVPAPPVQVHDSLQYALQSAYSHNEALGVLPSHSVVVSKKKKPKERRGENANAVAGNSTLHLPSIVTTNKKRGRPGKDDNDFEGVRKGKKRSRVDVDLTLSGDEQAHQNAKSTSSARTRYKAQTDTLLLYLGLIHPIPAPVLAHNTRFLRNYHAKNHGILPPNNAPSNGTASHRYFIPPKLPAQYDEAGDMMSIGGPLAWEEDFHLPVDDDSDGEVEFVEDVSGLNVRPPARVLPNPRPKPRPLPPKIDLAAEMRKKQNRKKSTGRVSAANSPKSTLQSPSAKYAAATSSSSSTGLHTENHQHNRNECQPQHENVTSSMPSAKALGKRKATNSEPPNDSFSSTPAPVIPNDPPILANPPEGLARGVDVFFHTFTRTPSPEQNPTSSTLVPYSNLQSLSSFYPSIGTTAQNDAQLVDNSAMSKFYQPDLLVNIEHSPERFLSETVLDSLEAHPKQSDPWSALEDDISGQYAFSTIDPTLLGGQPINPDPDSLDPEIELELEPQLPSLSSEPSSPTSHHSLDLSKDEYEPSTTTTDFVPHATNLTTSRESSAPSASGPFRNVPRRLHSQRKLPDMVAIDDLDIRSCSGSSSGYESSSSSSDVESESSAAVSSRPPVRTTLPAKSKSQELPPIPSRSQVWPLEETALYCHQCRTKNRILKMRCSCGKLFCARCITNRYPPGRFDYTQKQDNDCPHCQQFCNCTSCCSKRGETYVSTARPGPKKTVAKQQQPRGLRERVSLGGKTNLPPPTQLPSEPVKYWGAVYSLDGEKITSTFAPQTQEDHPPVVFGLLTSGEGVVKPKRQLQPKKVFVGRLQGHWGYSKHRRIKELVDKSYALPKKLTNKKKHYSGETRLYVGHRARLFWPRKESEYSFLLDDLSPLSSLEDDEDDEPDEIEPPHTEEKPRAASLGEDVVGQVIALALEACGTDSKVFPALV